MIPSFYDSNREEVECPRCGKKMLAMIFFNHRCKEDLDDKIIKEKLKKSEFVKDDVNSFITKNKKLMDSLGKMGDTYKHRK